MNLVKIAEYQIWANNIIREIVYSLTEEEFKKTFQEPLASVQEIIVHIILAIEYNLEVVYIKDSSSKNWYEYLIKKTKNELIEHWVETDKRLLNHITKMNDKILIFPDFFKGDGEINMIQQDFFFQYLSHTIYHRGQLMSALKLLGKKGKTTDYLFYLFDLNRGR